MNFKYNCILQYLKTSLKGLEDIHEILYSYPPARFVVARTTSHERAKAMQARRDVGTAGSYESLKIWGRVVMWKAQSPPIPAWLR